MNTEKQTYVSLTLEVIEIQMEKGYAVSYGSGGSDLENGGSW